MRRDRYLCFHARDALERRIRCCVCFLYIKDKGPAAASIVHSLCSSLWEISVSAICLFFLISPWFALFSFTNQPSRVPFTDLSTTIGILWFQIDLTLFKFKCFCGVRIIYIIWSKLKKMPILTGEIVYNLCAFVRESVPCSSVFQWNWAITTFGMFALSHTWNTFSVILERVTISTVSR